MASDGSVTAIGLLLFTAFTQGHFGMLDRSYSINATVGQRVTLPCLQEKEHNLTILQIEWKKMEGRAEVKIAICNPAYGSPYLFWTNVSVSSEMFESNLKGSVLELQEVSVWDSGIYVCELTAFPYGTVKAKTSLTVTVQLSLKVISQNEEVRLGEDVSILCASTPPADQYTVWTPRKQSLSLGADGKFRLQNVTKDDAGTYLCQPRWASPGPYDDAANATVQLRVSSGQALRGRTTPRVTSGSEGTLLLATHLLLVLCLSGPVV